MFDLIIRNAYLRKQDGIYDIGINKGKIFDISRKINDKGEIEIDANYNFVSPPFVDTHTHMDKSFTAIGERFPKYNDSSYIIDVPVSREKNISTGLEYFKNVTEEEIEKHILKHIYNQIINGTLFARTHVDIDNIAQIKSVTAALNVRNKVKNLFDFQIVAFAESGLLRDKESQKYVDMALKLGADLVGDLDPATVENNIEQSLDLIFEFAKKYDKDIDIHIMEPGTLGIYTIERLAKKIIDNNYYDRVTCSHAWSLGNAPVEWINIIIPILKKSKIKFVTCYTTTPYNFPLKMLIENEIPVACATDNVRDFWLIMGSGNPLQGLLIESQRLNMTSNNELDILWDTFTIQGAKILGITDIYGIEIGKNADLIIFDEPSPQWSIINQANKVYVIKNGKIIVENNNLLNEYKSLFNI